MVVVPVKIVRVRDDISLPAHGDNLTGQVKGDHRRPLLICVPANPDRVVGYPSDLRYRFGVCLHSSSRQVRHRRETA